MEDTNQLLVLRHENQADRPGLAQWAVLLPGYRGYCPDMCRRERQHRGCEFCIVIEVKIIY